MGLRGRSHSQLLSKVIPTGTLKCKFLPVLSLPFCHFLSPCVACWGGKELERWPWGWIFKWPPDFPTEQHQSGFHLHSSPSPFIAHQRWLSQRRLSTRPFCRTSNSDCELPRLHQRTSLPSTISSYRFTKLQMAEGGMKRLIIRIMVQKMAAHYHHWVYMCVGRGQCFHVALEGSTGQLDIISI